MAPINFTCPYCSRATTITEPNYFESWTKFELNKPVMEKMIDHYGEDYFEGLEKEQKAETIENIKKTDVGILTEVIRCPNTKCHKLFLHNSLWSAKYSKHYGWEKEERLYDWQLLPESQANVLPDYIPQAIQEDYYEACRIRDLSPKASATLSRRCLQGMIRDFWNIKKNRLIDEINELEEKIDPLVWGSIDAVRSVGNIGAHMEKEINLIVDVKPKEAQLLIGLIEQLIEDWYIDKHEKGKRLNKIKELAKDKQEIRKQKLPTKP